MKTIYENYNNPQELLISHKKYFGIFEIQKLDKAKPLDWTKFLSPFATKNYKTYIKPAFWIPSNVANMPRSVKNRD